MKEALEEYYDFVTKEHTSLEFATFFESQIDKAYKAGLGKIPKKRDLKEEEGWTREEMWEKADKCKYFEQSAEIDGWNACIDKMLEE